MRILTRSLTVAAAAGLLALPATAATAQSADTLTTTLNSLNGSGDTGTATVQFEGDDRVTVTVNTTDASPGLPHAQHIHIGGENVCPPASASGDDEFLTTPEGGPFYGAVKVSLTTEGDVGADSALAVERFPVASEAGTTTYQRTFDLPDGVSKSDVMNGAIVQHGISELFEDEAKYDGEMRSALSDDLPFEATAPVSCGVLVAAAGGGVAAGFGGGSATPSSPIGWAIAALAAAGLGVSLFRRERGSEA